MNRLTAALAGAPAVDIEAAKRLQHDVGSWTAGQIIPLLRQLHAQEPAVEEARNQLVAFDGALTGGTVPALYVAWETAVRRMLIEQRMPAPLRSDALSRLTDIVAPLVRPTRVWFDGDPVAARDRLLLDALATVVNEPGSSGGVESRSRSHSVTFVHPLGVSERARRRFNIGPFVMAGSTDTIFSVTPSTGPALQIIFDAADWDRSVGMNAPGQSSAASSPHFADLARLWAEGGYVPLPFSTAAVHANTESVLILAPRP